MGLGNGNPKSGDKGSNFNYELKVLQGLEAIANALDGGDPNNPVPAFEGACFSPSINLDQAADILNIVGHYQKVGNIVNCHILFSVSNSGQNIDTLTISGLPYADNGGLDARYLFVNATLDRNTNLQRNITLSSTTSSDIIFNLQVLPTTSIDGVYSFVISYPYNPDEC